MIARKSRHVLRYWSGPVLYLTMMILAWHYRPRVGSPGVILNRGVAFGLFSHTPSWILSLGTLALIALIVLFLRRWPSLRLTMSWILSAAAANWTDRILWGGVVDYWQIRPYPFIFNLADVILRLASILLVIQIVRLSRRPDKASDKSIHPSRS